MDISLYNIDNKEFNRICEEELGGAEKLQVLMKDYKQRAIKLAKI
jgi:hypothetical protein